LHCRGQQRAADAGDTNRRFSRLSADLFEPHNGSFAILRQLPVVSTTSEPSTCKKLAPPGGSGLPGSPTLSGGMIRFVSSGSMLSHPSFVKADENDLFPLVLLTAFSGLLSG